MSLEQALEDYLKARAAVSAIVDTKVYDTEVPPGNNYPSVTYQRISTPRVSGLDGPQGYATPRFQVTARARDKTVLANLADALRAALDGFKGTWGSVTVKTVRLIDERTLPDPNPPQSTNRIYVRQLDARIEHVESIPFHI